MAKLITSPERKALYWQRRALAKALAKRRENRRNKLRGKRDDA